MSSGRGGLRLVQAASAVIDEARRGAGCGDPCPDCAERYTDAHWFAAHAPEALRAEPSPIPDPDLVPLAPLSTRWR